MYMGKYNNRQLSKRASQRRQYKKQRLLLYFLSFVVGITILGFIATFALFAWFAKDLPSPGKLSESSENSTIFYDRDGEILYEMYKDKNRVPISLNDVSDHMKKATIAIEDKSFYTHKGISESGILRAFLTIVLKGNIQGGSTITQQLIKNVLLSSQRTASRKIKEMILAFEVERRYTKEQILEMYLNEAPYGGTYWGVGSAAKGYFDKEPNKLDIAESAILAGLPQSPTKYSPHIGEKDAWKKRAKDVLRRMREDKYITIDEEKEAVEKLDKIKFKASKLAINAPHFVFYIKDLIEEEYGAKIIEKGVKVKTTLSIEDQKITQKIVSEEIGKLKDYKVGNGALIVLDSKTGEILAMVGSYDFNDEKYGKYNATLGKRQPGSAIKPITYGLAFEKGYTPATVLMDIKTEFPNQGEEDYIPVNYDDKYRGPMQLRFTLGNSINIPAVKLLAMVGIKDFLQKASDMGLESLSPTQENLQRFGLAVTLGGGETTLLNLTSAFSVFANKGNKIEPSAILEIKDFKGKTLYKSPKPKEKKVFSEEVAFLTSHILSDNNARMEIFGANSYLNIYGKTVAAKTGTTDDKRDNWTLGFTKDITVGVWVGNNDNSPMNQEIASGITGASPIWHRVMTELLKKYEDGIMEKPEKVKAVQIDSMFGGLPKDENQTRSEYFIEGSEPKDISSFYKKLKISKANGKLANDVEIKNGNYEEKEYIVISENDPISTDGKNRWQDAIDKWRGEQGDDKYHYPTEVSDSSKDDVVVSIKNPSGEQRLDNNDIEIRAKIISGEKIKNIKIYINGDEIKNINEDTNEINVSIHLEDGAYELQVKATNEKDKEGESTIKFGVNEEWDYEEETPTPEPTEETD